MPAAPEPGISADGADEGTRTDSTSPQQPKTAKEAGASSSSLKRNAFSELMMPKPKQHKIEPAEKEKTMIFTDGKPIVLPRNLGNYRTSLLPYIVEPESCPRGSIVRTTEHTVLIKDALPKGLVHLLLLPKDPDFYALMPFEAFNPDPHDESLLEKHSAFLRMMHEEAESAASLAATELSRIISPYSESCKTRNEALASDDVSKKLPSGRDFRPDIKIGIHAQPSMATLHVHIMSVDNYSERLKHKKHYNSFNTHFFVPLDDFPLMEGDNILDPVEQKHLIEGDMKCWRCGENFGNKFKQLKEHLEDEYKAWRKI